MLSALSRARTPHASRLPSLSAAPTRTQNLNFWSRIRTLSLAGTVPFHDACIFLHTHQPPTEYPARSRSPLWRALTLKGREWGCVVNFAWAPGQAVHGAYAGLGEEFRDRDRGGAQEDEAGEGKGEAYVASVFVRGHRGRVEIPEVTLKNVDEIAAAIQQRIAMTQMTPMTLRAGAAGVATQQAEDIIHREGHTHRKEQAEEQAEMEVGADADRLYLYVCTHGSRDCRCGDAGGDVVRALRAEVARRGIADEVFVGEVAHVGGHKYAANVLVYPYGDWLGNVQDFDVPRLMDEMLAYHRTSRTATAAGSLGTDAPPDALVSMPPLCPPHWRGRMGLDKQQQQALV